MSKIIIISTLFFTLRQISQNQKEVVIDSPHEKSLKITHRTQKNI